MTFVRVRSTMPASVDELFAFHRDASNLPRIAPPIPKVRLLSPVEPSQEGATQEIEFSFGPIRQVWLARVTRIREPFLIEDVQERGPFRAWRHQHRFIPGEGGNAVLEDAVSFRLWPTPLGEFCEFLLVRPAIVAMFWIRHKRTARLLDHQGANPNE